jgi:hypothetical protein
LKQRFRLEISQVFVRDIGNNQVLTDGQPHLTIAVGVGQESRFQKLRSGYTTYWDCQPRIAKARLFLGKDSDVVSPAIPGGVFPGSQQQMTNPAFHLLPEPLHTPA